MRSPGHLKDKQANKLVRKWRSCAANWDNVSESGEVTFAMRPFRHRPFSVRLLLGNLWNGFLLFTSELFPTESHAHACTYRIYKIPSCACRTFWLLTKASYGEWCFCKLAFSPSKTCLEDLLMEAHTDPLYSFETLNFLLFHTLLGHIPADGHAGCF